MKVSCRIPRCCVFPNSPLLHSRPLCSPSAQSPCRTVPARHSCSRVCPPHTDILRPDHRTEAQQRILLQFTTIGKRKIHALPPQCPTPNRPAHLRPAQPRPLRPRPSRQCEDGMGDWWRRANSGWSEMHGIYPGMPQYSFQITIDQALRVARFSQRSSDLTLFISLKADTSSGSWTTATSTPTILVASAPVLVSSQCSLLG